jgi:hypothetical protein
MFKKSWNPQLAEEAIFSPQDHVCACVIAMVDHIHGFTSRLPAIPDGPGTFG